MYRNKCPKHVSPFNGTARSHSHTRPHQDWRWNCEGHAPWEFSFASPMCNIIGANASRCWLPAVLYFASLMAVYGPCGSISMLCTLTTSLVAGSASRLVTNSLNSESSRTAARRLSRSSLEG